MRLSGVFFARPNAAFILFLYKRSNQVNVVLFDKASVLKKHAQSSNYDGNTFHKVRSTRLETP